MRFQALDLIPVEDEPPGWLPRLIADAPGEPCVLIPLAGGRTHRPGDGVGPGRVGHPGVRGRPSLRGGVVVVGQRVAVLRLGLNVGAELSQGAYGCRWLQLEGNVLVTGFVQGSSGVYGWTNAATSGNKNAHRLGSLCWQGVAADQRRS